MTQNLSDIPLDLSSDFEQCDTSDFPEDAAPAAAMAVEKSATAYSTTNVQVAGVDEADVIKNDGEFIYIVKGKTVRIVKAYPSDTMEEIAKVELDDGSFAPQDIYITDSTLVVIAAAQGSKAASFILGKHVAEAA